LSRLYFSRPIDRFLVENDRSWIFYKQISVHKSSNSHKGKVNMRWFLLLGCLFICLCHQAAAATAGAAEKLSATETLALQVSAGKLIRLKAPAARIFVADPAIADIQAPGPASIFVFGKKPGRTTLFALASDGRWCTC
jgi:pilus assembly protein CpaC